MHENEVIIKACKCLQRDGWVVQHSATQSGGQGPDIIAIRNGLKLLVQAKGSTNMDGKAFKSNEKEKYVGNVVYQALKLRAKHRDPTETAVAVALPRDGTYVNALNANDLWEFLGERLNIGVIWMCDEDDDPEGDDIIWCNPP